MCLARPRQDRNVPDDILRLRDNTKGVLSKRGYLETRIYLVLCAQHRAVHFSLFQSITVMATPKVWAKIQPLESPVNLLDITTEQLAASIQER